jgi:hypothetical protein
VVRVVVFARYAGRARTMSTTRKKEPGALATYLYCVVKADAAPSLTKIKGASGLVAAGPPRTIDVGDGYHVVVATVPLKLYSSEAIEAKLRDLDWVGAAASAHEAVVERAAQNGTVVPMKLFTIFSTDDRAAEHVRKMKKSLEKVVAKIAGCEEWGLRILFDETSAAKAKEKLEAAKPKAPVSGTSFLLRKKAHEESRRRLTSEAKHEVDDLFVRLEKTAKSSVRRPPPNRELAGQVLLDAVFLVPEKRIAKFKSTVATSAKDLANEGYHVTLTGPWPAYSFIEGR